MSYFSRIAHRIRRIWGETVAPPLLGEPPALRRLWRIRLRSALVLAVPAHLVMLFYLVQGCLAHHRTIRGTGEDQPLTLELLQLHVYDRLRRDFHRLTIGSGGPTASLERLSLHLRNDLIDRLDANLPPKDGAEGYVNGVLEYRNRRYQVDVRYRGSKHWNWNYPQKSFKIRLKDNRRLVGHETILLDNSPEAEPLLELVILDIARKRGLMVPHYDPVWLELNGAPFGVYFLEAPVDESVLRQARRFPWNIYSGNRAATNRETGVSRLFESATHWTKVAGPIGQGTDLSELEDLLQRIQRADPLAFQRYAEDRIDLKAFAEFDALDVVFGIDQHNYDENQKLYYDPHRGVFEPIVWNVRGGTHEPVVQRAPSPLVLRLSEMTSFVELRDQAVWQLLEGDGSGEALERALSRWDERLGDAFQQDPYWDAADLLPELSRYYEEMVRPMDRMRHVEARRVELAKLRERHDFLRRELGHSTLDASLFVSERDAGSAEDAASKQLGQRPPSVVLRLTVGGRAPLDVLALTPRFASTCQSSRATFRRVPPAGRPDSDARDLVTAGAASADETLWPATVRVSRPVTPSRGGVRLEPAIRHYDYELVDASCTPESVLVRVRNRRTSAVIEQSAAPRTSAEPLEPCPLVFQAGIGGRALHPRCAPPPRAAAEVHLGPGEHEVTGVTVYGPEQKVVIAPGTSIRLGPKASLVFRGQVVAEGLPDRPIRFHGQGFGAIAIQGKAAARSSLRHVDISGGSGAVVEGRHYSGMLNAYDTEHFSLSDARLHGATSEDLLHLAYVRRGILSRVRVEDGPSDGVDIEHSSVTIRSLTVAGVRDDALDLMAAKVTAKGLNLLDCGDNGVSAGEESEVILTDVLVARCPIGVLVKNASQLVVEDVLVASAKVGLRLERRSDYYRDESVTRGKRLWFLGVEEQHQLVDRPIFEVSPIGSPAAEDLASLFASRGLTQTSELVRYRGPAGGSP